MGRKQLSPGERMYKAIERSDISPIIAEIHYNPFLWVTCLIVAFFVLGNILEIVMLLTRDIRCFLLRILRYPRRVIRRFTESIKKRFVKRYGKKRRGDRSLFKK